jgi:hypothetical protein
LRGLVSPASRRSHYGQAERRRPTNSEFSIQRARTRTFHLKGRVPTICDGALVSILVVFEGIVDRPVILGQWLDRHDMRRIGLLMPQFLRGAKRIGIVATAAPTCIFNNCRFPAPTLDPVFKKRTR